MESGKMELINVGENEKLDKNIIIEQYKTYVESADRNSDRRINTNNFYIVLNSIIITITGIFINEDNICFVMFILGIIFSLIWLLNLINYKNISSCKYHIINEIEKLLPLKMFEYEWKKLDNGKNIKKYIPVTNIEKIIPIIFMIIYVFLMVVKISQKIDIVVIMK
jgi:hypothetical protein